MNSRCRCAGRITVRSIAAGRKARGGRTVAGPDARCLVDRGGLYGRDLAHNFVG
jgi:hypothetical protein